MCRNQSQLIIQTEYPILRVSHIFCFGNRGNYATPNNSRCDCNGAFYTFNIRGSSCSSVDAGLQLHPEPLPPKLLQQASRSRSKLMRNLVLVMTKSTMSNRQTSPQAICPWPVRRTWTASSATSARAPDMPNICMIPELAAHVAAPFAEMHSSSTVSWAANRDLGPLAKVLCSSSTSKQLSGPN